MNGRYWLVRYKGDRWVPDVRMKFAAWCWVWAQGWAWHGRYLSFVHSCLVLGDSNSMPGGELAAAVPVDNLVVEQDAGYLCMIADSES